MREVNCRSKNRMLPSPQWRTWPTEIGVWPISQAAESLLGKVPGTPMMRLPAPAAAPVDKHGLLRHKIWSRDTYPIACTGEGCGMPGPRYLAAFDDNARAWEEYTCTPLGKLRQDLTLHHLFQHLGALSGALSVLDVGGGPGPYTLSLAKAGHHRSLYWISRPPCWRTPNRGSSALTRT